jgi:hypothetical protein
MMNVQLLLVFLLDALYEPLAYATALLTAILVCITLVSLVQDAFQ